MPLVFKTIDKYIRRKKKKSTYCMVFNKVYNEAHFLEKMPYEDINSYKKKNYTDNVAREEFLQFMKERFPNTNLVKIIYKVDLEYLIYPYTGTIIVDCEKDDEVYNAICAKYEDSNGNYISNNAVFWLFEYHADIKKVSKENIYFDGAFLPF